MENYNISKDDKMTQRDITARFFYLGNRYNETEDDLETNVILNGSNFGV
jgi:hypothetical protein